MSNDLIEDTRQMAAAYGVEFIDKGNGHIQLKGHGNLVNYYPTSKRRSLWSPTLNRRERHCSPWDAVRLCLSEAKPGMKPKKPTKNPADFDLKPVCQNPAGIRHFYDGDTPPWSPSLGAFRFLCVSDELRWYAQQLEDENGSELRSSCGPAPGELSGGFARVHEQSGG